MILPFVAPKRVVSTSAHDATQAQNAVSMPNKLLSTDCLRSRATCFPSDRVVIDDALQGE